MQRNFTIQEHFCYNSLNNKKVLLRERKRHTTRRVASTPYVVLTGNPPPPARVPPRQGIPPGQGTPLARVPPGPGYPPWLDLAGYPPGCPMAFWEMLQSIMGYGYPPPRCEQTENITFPHPSDADGKNTL